ncbi:Lipid transfer protein [Medicago truncatula]|uniref:Lipid transfer protein n=1 Tax=Medicago truncatula TaxID=3880 RepID=G7IPD4_MEDTR|nr:Lipid transfer protein [Medicago truncatula]
MGSKGVGSIFIIFLNLLLVSTLVASHTPRRPPPPPCLSTPPPVDTPSTPPPVVTPSTPPPSTPPPSTPPSPSPPIITPSAPPPSTPPPTTPPSTPPSIPRTPPSTPPPIPVTPPQNCNLLNLNICAKVLNNVVVLNPRNNRCCTLISGLVDLDAAVCVCAALKANIIGISVNINADLKIILNSCGVNTPAGFTCRR